VDATAAPEFSAALAAPRESNDGGMAAGHEDRSSYEDTQPELPIIRSLDDRPSDPQPSSVTSSADRSEPADAPRSPAPETLRQAQDRATAETAPRRTTIPEKALETDVARTSAKPAEAPIPKSNGAPEDADKPAGRLLPWERLEERQERTESAGLGKSDEKADRSDSEA
jgi:hypothetical protein